MSRAGKVSQAKALFEKAAGMSKDAAITNNLGVVALMSCQLLRLRNISLL